MPNLATATRNACADAAVDLFDGGSGPGTIDIRTGARPATAQDAASGTLLATFTLADPAFGASATGVTTLDATPVLTTTGLAAGTAGWARGKDSNGATVMDFTLSATGGGGEVQLSTTTVSIGLDLELTAGTVTMPAG